MTKRIMAVAICACAIAALAIPKKIHGQPNQGLYHHYKLIDLGTLGGPDSVIFGLTGPLNESGAVSSCATTSIPDPNFPNISPYFSAPGDSFIQHAFVWRGGALVDLGTLPGGTSSCEQWISDTGFIVGGSSNGLIDPQLGYPEVHATFWLGRRALDLGTLGGNNSIAFSVNDFGEAAGGAANTVTDSYTGPFFFSGTQVHATVWIGGMIKDLGTLGTGTDSMAFYVNDLGQVSGFSLTNNVVNATTGLPTVDPFLWENDTMIDLGTLGGVYGEANGFNNKGQSAGFSDLAGDQTSHPFLWTRENGMEDLGTLGGTFGVAEWMNDSTEIVGVATNSGDQLPLAFLWKDGVMIDLNPASDTSGEAEGINASGQIVGSSADSQGNSYGFLWENGGPMVHLQDLAVPGGPNVTFVDASYINNRGEIAGNAMLPNGDNHAVVLIPCDHNHPGIGGCDYSLVDANTLAAARLAQAAGRSQAPAHSARLSAAEMTARVRSLMLNRHHRFGAALMR